MSIFRFRQFSVSQERAAMKIGTDSVLLGCFCVPAQANNILDIGTGTGLLALMLAQKSPAHIDAVEIDQEAFEEAKSNAAASPWAGRIRVHHYALQDFNTDKRYDLIISNPPYFVAGQNLKIGDLQRRQARHDASLPFDVFCSKVQSLLTDTGCCWLILPSAEASLFKEVAATGGLCLHKEIFIHPKPSKPANRIVMCFAKQVMAYESSRFVIYDDGGKPSEAYIALTRDYYLWKGLSDEQQDPT